MKSEDNFVVMYIRLVKERDEINDKIKALKVICDVFNIELPGVKKVIRKEKVAAAKVPVKSQSKKGHCSICGKGPFKRISMHLNQKHGKKRK